MITERTKEETKMMNWYENPEIHAEDYEEMTELLKALAEEEGE